jgi:hypothetical protein
MPDPKRRGGRPPRAGVARSVSVDVPLTPEERERYRRAAEAAGTSLADEARRAWERLEQRVQAGRA